MSDEVEALRAEVAALRDELSAMRVAESEKSISRRRLLTGLAGLGAVGATGIASAPSAAADDGDPLILGQLNVSGGATTLTSESPTTFSSNDPDCTLQVNNTGSGFAARFSHGIHSFGIIGVSGAGFLGVYGESDDGTAVGAQAYDNAIGLNVESEHAAAVQIKPIDGPHLVFTPVNGQGPTDGDVPVDAGALTVDSNLDLWFCTAAGDPPTWTRLLREDTAAGRVIPVAPMRVLDTRATGGRPSGAPAVPGQKKGPLKGGEAITLDLAGVSTIPGSASGVVGNLIAVKPSYTGYVRAAPSGSPLNGTALSFAPGPNIGNAFTVGLGPSGVTFRGSGTAANTYHLVVDVTAHIT